MAREERSYEKLPNFSSLRGLLLNSVCLMDRPVDLGQRRTQQHFYQVGGTDSLHMKFCICHSAEGVDHGLLVCDNEWSV